MGPDAELVKTIMKSLAEHKKWVWSDLETRFIPVPATWLNQRRWESEIEPDEEETLESKIKAKKDRRKKPDTPAICLRRSEKPSNRRSMKNENGKRSAK